MESIFSGLILPQAARPLSCLIRVSHLPCSYLHAYEHRGHRSLLLRKAPLASGLPVTTQAQTPEPQREGEKENNSPKNTENSHRQSLSPTFLAHHGCNYIQAGLGTDRASDRSQGDDHLLKPCSVGLEMSPILSASCDGHQSHVAIEHLKCVTELGYSFHLLLIN